MISYEDNVMVRVLRGDKDAETEEFINSLALQLLKEIREERIKEEAVAASEVKA